MAILLHVLIAIASLVYTAYVFMFPSQAKLKAAYALVALTIITGTYLIFAMPAQMLQTCETGLAYLAVMGVAIAVTRTKLAAQAN